MERYHSRGNEPVQLHRGKRLRRHPGGKLDTQVPTVIQVEVEFQSRAKEKVPEQRGELGDRLLVYWIVRNV